MFVIDGFWLLGFGANGLVEKPAAGWLDDIPVVVAVSSTLPVPGRRERSVEEKAAAAAVVCESEGPLADNSLSSVSTLLAAPPTAGP